MYQITATISYTKPDANGHAWNGCRQIPTFYLDEQIQGIVSADHAARIATTVINPLADILTEMGIRDVMVSVDATHVTVGSHGETATS